MRSAAEGGSAVRTGAETATDTIELLCGGWTNDQIRILVNLKGSTDGSSLWLQGICAGLSGEAGGVGAGDRPERLRLERRGAVAVLEGGQGLPPAGAEVRRQVRRPRGVPDPDVDDDSGGAREGVGAAGARRRRSQSQSSETNSASSNGPS